MRRLLVVALSAAALTVLPQTSTAGPVRDLVRSAALAAGTSVASLDRERLVGITWTGGRAQVSYRWLGPHGWGAWRTADEDTSEEGIPGTAPLWRPAGAVAVGVRVTGDAVGLRLVRVSDGRARRFAGAVAHAETGRAVLGTVRTRAAWGADESLVRRAPTYAGSVQAVTVHHTDDLNGYPPEDVPRIIRADYSYHVETRGWSDLGYNLLVDAYGRIWEGRRGGIGRTVIGSHAQGFNTGTLGVSVIGDLTQTRATPETRKALARVIAFASSTWHWDPRGTVRLRSKGSPRYPSGRVVLLHRVFGHGETGVTDCPGSLQQDLPGLRELALVALQPAPRVLSSRLSGAPMHAPDPVAVDARLNKGTPWQLLFRDPGGAVVASAAGRRSAPHLAWDGRQRQDLPLPAAPGTYRWTLTADDGFHDRVQVEGTFDVGLPRATLLTRGSPRPAAVVEGEDGRRHER